MRQPAFAKLVQYFCSNHNGNFTIALGATLAVLMMGAGFAVNIGQLYHVRSGLMNSVDSAVTSTARDLTTGKIAAEEAEATVAAFLEANFAGTYVSLRDIRIDRLVVNRVAKTVTAAVSTDLDVLFPFFGTSNRVRVSVESSALYSDRLIEVAMMLDITGSMSGRKIRDLKSAATSAVTAFLAGQNPANPRVRVALVPYSNAVNVGGLAATTVYVEKGFTTGEPPSSHDPVLVATAPDNCATERKGSHQFDNSGPDIAMVNRDYRVSSCPTASMVPLTTDIKKLNHTIGNFSASGTTAGHIGVQWTWYMLSRQWARFLPASARPDKKNPAKVAKIAILMTDGEFNTAYAGVPKGESIAPGQRGRSRTYAEHLCSEMKKDGIEIFAIGFDLDSAEARGVLKNCASHSSGSIKHYYEAANGPELEAAFLEIAANIERLTLVK